MSSGVELTCSKLTEGEESALGLGEQRDLASDILGLKSWVTLWPSSVLIGRDIVRVDIGVRLSMCSLLTQDIFPCEGQGRKREHTVVTYLRNRV